MKKLAVSCYLFLALFLVACQTETEVTTKMSTNRITHNAPAYSEGVAYGADLWTQNITFADPSRDVTEEGIQAIWIRSDVNNQESYAFSYLGIPDNGDGRAVILLHGGGGTSYREWVNQWMDRGYIALAIDLEGHIPKPEGTLNDFPQNLYTNSMYPTPKNSNYADASLPLEETWMHYATRTVILAHTFLRSVTGVDPLKIGLVGISWGGIITSIVGGYDDRFAFLIPIYCSLNQTGTFTSISGYLENHPDALIWDSDLALQTVSMPIHFVVSNTDAHCRLDSIALTLSRVKNGSLTVIKDWPHSHADAVAASEPYEAADRLIAQQSLVHFTEVSLGNATLFIPENLTLIESYLIYTTEPLSLQTSWSKRRGSQDSVELSYNLPEGTTYYYLSVIDNRGNTWSSTLIDVNDHS
ncbi:MAG: hypothetical protein WC172_03740 [Candidatus Izemoplasmatales bacterium]